MVEHPVGQFPASKFFVGQFKAETLARLARIAPDMTIKELYLVNKVN